MLKERLYVVPRVGVDEVEDAENVVSLLFEKDLLPEYEDELDIEERRRNIFLFNTVLTFAQAVIMWNDEAIYKGDDHLTDAQLARMLGVPGYELDTLRSEAQYILDSNQDFNYQP